MILPFDEVVAALGRRGEKRLGLQTIPLDSIVGTVDRGREFDRSFRPTSGRVRGRWERIAEAMRRGQSLPPIDVYRVGDMHFVRDGHHRVSVARTLGHDVIDAYVTEVITETSPDEAIRVSDLPLKSHERLFFERVPLPREARLRVQPSDRAAYAELAESVEAWGFRAMQATREFMTREEVAERWYREEYVPVVEMLREAGSPPSRTRRTPTWRSWPCATCCCAPTTGTRTCRGAARGDAPALVGEHRDQAPAEDAEVGARRPTPEAAARAGGGGPPPRRPRLAPGCAPAGSVLRQWPWARRSSRLRRK